MNRYNQIMIMGAGAVGGYFGGCLAARTSAEVSMIARGAHLKAMQQHGLQIKSVDGDFTVRVDAFDNPGQTSEPDLILFTVKSYDTAKAIEAIRPVVAAHTQILTIQNGIENYPKLVRAFGNDRVIQGFCKIGAGIAEPGVIKHRAFGKITVGEKTGETTARLTSLQELFQKAGIPLHITSEINRKVWLKFAWNAIFNMLTAVTNVTVEKLFTHSETEALCYKLFDEIRTVAEIEGVHLTRQDAKNIIEPARKLAGFETSTYQDRQKGKKLEYEAFTGAIVRLAEQYGLQVQHNETLYSLLKPIDKEL